MWREKKEDMKHLISCGMAEEQCVYVFYLYFPYPLSFSLPPSVTCDVAITITSQVSVAKKTM